MTDPNGPKRQNPARRRAALALVVLGVLVAHAWLGWQLDESRLGERAGDKAPAAIEVAFVKELATTAAPVFAAPARPVTAAGQSLPVPKPASAPPPEPAPSHPALEHAQAESAPQPDAVSAPASHASTPVTPVAVAPSSAPTHAPAPAFDWPPSTLLSYRLTGQYRDAIYGSAQVEWRRQAEHYQVRLTVKIPLFFEQRMLSDGLLGPQGLMPRRYDQERDLPFKATQRETVLLDANSIQLANGRTEPALAGVQDTASQFVQMTWLFLTQPQRLQVGQSVTFPLALPRRVGQWTYDVQPAETLSLPLGEIEAFHLQPRLDSRRGNEWTVDMWFAPGLQYLPVRMLIRQSADVYFELQLASRPLQAAVPAAR